MHVFIFVLFCAVQVIAKWKQAIQFQMDYFYILTYFREY